MKLEGTKKKKTVIEEPCALFETCTAEEWAIAAAVLDDLINEVKKEETPIMRILTRKEHYVFSSVLESAFKEMVKDYVMGYDRNVDETWSRAFDIVEARKATYREQDRTMILKCPDGIDRNKLTQWIIDNFDEEKLK